MVQEKFKMKYFLTIFTTLLITSALLVGGYYYVQKKHQDETNLQISQLKTEIEVANGCSSSLKSYTDTSNKYSFSYPDNLKTDFWSDILNLTDIQSNKVVAVVHLFRNNEDLTLEQVSKKAPNDINSYLGDYQEKAIDPSSVTYTNTNISDRGATKYTIAQQINGSIYSGYAIVAGDMPGGSRNEYYEIFGSSNCVLDQIAKSFKIL